MFECIREATQESLNDCNLDVPLHFFICKTPTHFVTTGYSTGRNSVVGLQFCIRNTPTWRTWQQVFLIFRHDSVNSALHSDVHQCKLAVKAILHRILSWKLDFTEFYCILRHRWTFELRLLDCILLFAAINLNIQTRQHLHLLWVRISYVQKLGCTYFQCQFFL